MRSTEERMQCIRERASDMRKEEKKRSVLGLGSASLALLVFLVESVRLAGQSLQSDIDIHLSGSSLLSSEAGGYVLVAAVSFSAAVLITVICMRWQRKKKERNETEASPPAVSEKEGSPNGSPESDNRE